MAAALACIIPAEAFQIRDMAIGSFPSTTSAIEARLVSPSASDFALNIVPPRVHADRPLEVELASVGLGAGAGVAESIANWISAHAFLQISVKAPGQPGEVSLRVKARPSGFGAGWVARALTRPATWADATSVTVVSLTVAGRLLPCDSLPATLRVSYNHAPAPVGEVFAAVQAGDIPALIAAIEAGGSTEEADTVRGGVVLGGSASQGTTAQAEDAPLVVPRHLC